MKRFLNLILFVLTTLLLAGCLGGKSEVFQFGSSAAPPSNLKAVAGDGEVTLTWNSQPGVEYWVFYAPGEGVTTDNWDTRGGQALPKATSPYTVPFLKNGQLYSFTVNARIDGGPGGPGAPSITATPRSLGDDWSDNGPRPAPGNLNAIIYRNNRFIVAGNQGALYSSPDLENGKPTWTKLTTPATADLYAITYGNSLYLAAGANGIILRSENGTSWTTQTSGVNKALNALDYGLDGNAQPVFVAAGETGTILTSPDGKNWTRRNSNTLWNLKAVLFTGAYWVAVGDAGTIRLSLDSITWLKPETVGGPLLPPNLNSVTIGLDRNNQPLLVAVGGLGAQLTSQNNGATWTHSTINAGTHFRGLTYGRRFIAVGPFGAIYTSLDGSNWTRQESGTVATLNAVAYSESGNIAIAGDNGSVLCGEVFEMAQSQKNAGKSRY